MKTGGVIVPSTFHYTDMEQD